MTKDQLLPQALYMLGSTQACRTLDQSCDDGSGPDGKCCNADPATNEKLECKNSKCIKKAACQTLDQSCDDGSGPDNKCCDTDPATNEELECKNFKCIKKAECQKENQLCAIPKNLK